jgi:tRNA dimethylallyltransferase
MNHLIVVVGPTAVGKTAVALKLAVHYKAEIVSADSRQIFKELTLGTAKPDEAELRQARHHFIDSHSIKEEYDAAQFGREALDLIHELFKHHSHAILCGGSGLYIKAVLEGFDDIPEISPEVRQDIIDRYNQNGLAWLQQKMQESDPDHFAVLDQQNPQRLMRALEVKLATGKSISSFQKQKKRPDHTFQIHKIGLELDRDELYQRIDLRMDQMIQSGLFAEAEQLFPYREHHALQTVGYQEIFGFLEGQYDREEAIRLLKRNSRRYAKRQLTWFKRDPEIRWFNPRDLSSMIEWIG